MLISFSIDNNYRLLPYGFRLVYSVVKTPFSDSVRLHSMLNSGIQRGARHRGPLRHVYMCIVVTVIPTNRVS